MTNKVYSKVIAVISIVALLFTGVISTFPVNAATYSTVYYSAGDHENMVSATEFSIAIPQGSSFELSESTRFSRKGYELIGWYINTTDEYIGCGAPYVMPTYDLYVDAVWEALEYSVGFAGLGGTTASGESNIYIDGTYGVPMTLPENPFTKEGYIFSGWKYDGVVYQEGDTFEIPALTVGLKVVLSAVWTKEATVTTAATTTTTTTTTVATTVLEDDQVIKTASVGKEVTVGSSSKYYLSNLVETGDIIDSLTFNYKVDSGYVGTVSFALASTLTDGTWKQVDFQGSSLTDTLSISFGDKDVCNLLRTSGNITIACWYAENTPLTLDSVEAVVREPAETTTTTKATTTTTTTTTKATTTTTTTTTKATTTTTTTTTKATTTTTTTTTKATTTTTTTTTKATTTTTTTTTKATTTTTTTTTKATTTTTTKATTTTTTYTLAASPLSRTVYINETVSMGNTLNIPVEELLNSNEIVESIEMTIKSDDGQIDNYNLGFIMSMENYSSIQANLTGNTALGTITLPIEISADKQIYANMDTNVTIGYWWGNDQTITIESIKINYRVEETVENNNGDVDGDGIVDNNDLNTLKKFMVGTCNESISIEEADINSDGRLNVFDVIILERTIA